MKQVCWTHMMLRFLVCFGLFFRFVVGLPSTPPMSNFCEC